MSIDPNAPTCPDDGTALRWQDKGWHCPQCASNFELQGLCDKCGQTLEKLNACGATNWFCKHCNALRSKSSIAYNLVKTPQ